MQYMHYVPILDCENFLFLERSGPKGFRRDKRRLASASLLKCGRRHARFWGNTREILFILKNVTGNRGGKGRVSTDEPFITARLCFRCVVISFNPVKQPLASFCRGEIGTRLRSHSYDVAGLELKLQCISLHTLGS